MFVHLSVDEHEIRSDCSHRIGKAPDRQRGDGPTTAFPKVDNPVERTSSGIRLEELVVATRFQRKEVETVTLDEQSGVGKTGVGQAMAVAARRRASSTLE